jgi:hypothetical protein
MIKKKFTYILSFLLLIGSLYAELDTTVEVRYAEFFPSSKKFKKIYGNSNPDYQIQASTRSYGPLEIWTNFDWFTKKKHKDFGYKTKIEIMDASIGVQYVYKNWPAFDLYAGIGPVFGKIHLKNKTCCMDETFSKTSFGAVGKAGIRYLVYQELFIDLFFDYLYQYVRIDHQHINVGGFKGGIGVGTKF